MQSSWHNTPAPAGHPQAAGRAYRAADVSASLSAAAAELALELAAAYPAAAGVRSWRRTLRLDRAAGHIAVHDRWELSEVSQRTACYLVTPEEPQVAGATILLPSGLVIEVDAPADGAGAVRVSVERRDLDDPQLRSVWGEHLYRIILTSPGRAARSPRWSGPPGPARRASRAGTVRPAPRSTPRPAARTRGRRATLSSGGGTP